MHHTPGYPPPKKNHTNTIIIGAATALIAAIIGTGIFVAQSRDDDSESVTDTPSASITAEPTPSLSVSPACRTWIKAELLDDSETVDATPGYEACGDLSEEELQAAIDEVTAELSAEITPEP